MKKTTARNFLPTSPMYDSVEIVRDTTQSGEPVTVTNEGKHSEISAVTGAELKRRQDEAFAVEGDAIQRLRKTAGGLAELQGRILCEAVGSVEEKPRHPHLILGSLRENLERLQNLYPEIGLDRALELVEELDSSVTHLMYSASLRGGKR